MGNPLLREQSILFEPDEITSVETQELVKDMWETMDEYGGVGLAAPQIGVSKQLAVIRIEEDNERYPDAEKSEFVGISEFSNFTFFESLASQMFFVLANVFTQRYPR